jgi:hypothetical protein
MTFLPGNGNIYEFTDKEYEYFVQHALVENGTYTTGRDTPQHIMNVPTEMDFMILQRGKLYYEISDNTLTIYDGDIALDGSIETYARIK